MRAPYILAARGTVPVQQIVRRLRSTPVASLMLGGTVSTIPLPKPPVRTVSALHKFFWDKYFFTQLVPNNSLGFYGKQYGLVDLDSN